MPKDPAKTIVALWKYDVNERWHQTIKASLRREWPAMYQAIKRLEKKHDKEKKK